MIRTNDYIISKLRRYRDMARGRHYGQLQAELSAELDAMEAERKQADELVAMFADGVQQACESPDVRDIVQRVARCSQTEYPDSPDQTRFSWDRSAAGDESDGQGEQVDPGYRYACGEIEVDPERMREFHAAASERAGQGDAGDGGAECPACGQNNWDADDDDNMDVCRHCGHRDARPSL